jgi:hypothetical protein
VAVLVVDALEVVGVDHEDAEGVLIAAHALELVVHEIHDVPVVEQVGEAVADGEVPHALEEPAVLHDDVRLVRDLGQEGARLRRHLADRASGEHEHPGEPVVRLDGEGGEGVQRRLLRAVPAARRSEEAGAHAAPRALPPRAATIASSIRALASSTTGGAARRFRSSSMSTSSCSTKAMAPTVNSTTRATSAITDVNDSSNCTRLRATRPISERMVAS